MRKADNSRLRKNSGEKTAKNVSVKICSHKMRFKKYAFQTV